MRTPEHDARTVGSDRALHDALSLVEQELEAVRARIGEQLRTPHESVNALLRQVAASGGKMLRPALALLSARCFGPVRPAHIDLAAVVEMIHTASLLHDDVIDEARRRRGRETMNALHGNEIAVLLGDFLLSRVFALGVGIENAEVARSLAETAVRLCRGELLQNTQRDNAGIDEATYLNIVRDKTAELFATCCHLGAVVAEADHMSCQALREYGMNLGTAFQITDDLLDVLGDPQRVGKTLGTDLAKRKFTLPLIHHMQALPGEAREELVERLCGPDAAERLPELLARTDSIAYARARAADYARDAMDALDVIAPGPARRSLKAVADYVRTRAS